MPVFLCVSFAHRGRAADRGWLEDYIVHNAFGGYVEKPLKSQLREPSSGEHTVKCLG